MGLAEECLDEETALAYLDGALPQNRRYTVEHDRGGAPRASARSASARR
jgi:hypothetical protein